MHDLRIKPDRLWDSLMDMARIGATPKGGCNRQALTDEDKLGRELFIRWGRAIGCDVRVDAIGNIFCRREGSHPELPPVLIGSHLDTQPTGGRFDGVYGVLAGVEVLRTLEENGVATERAVEAVSWTNEEGARFAPALMGSGVWSGAFDLHETYQTTDRNGDTVSDVLVAVQRLLRVTEIFDTILDGFKSMLLPHGTVVAGFMLKEVNDDLGLAPYVIGVVQPLMTPELLPLVSFLTIALIAFATGSFWGIIVVAMPIVIPLAEAVNADSSLVIGALISASAFGSHTCFYGDSTVLSAHGSGCGAIDHALTQLPYALLAAGAASVAFIIAGYALG